MMRQAIMRAPMKMESGQFSNNGIDCIFPFIPLHFWKIVLKFLYTYGL